MPLALKKNSKVISKNDIINYAQKELWNVISTNLKDTVAKSIILKDAVDLVRMDQSDLLQQVNQLQSQKTVTVLQYSHNQEVINYDLPENIIKKNSQAFIKTRPVDNNATETLMHISRYSIDRLATQTQNELARIVEIFENMPDAEFNELINSPVNLTSTDEFEKMQPASYAYIKEYIKFNTLNMNSLGLMSHINTIITLYKLLV